VALQLPGMESVSYVARGCFVVAFITAFLATFFTALQLRTYGFLLEPTAIRLWLANGVRYTNAERRKVFQSSTVSYQLLQLPFELLCMSITVSIGGVGVYLGSAMTERVKLGSVENDDVGNRGILITFVICTTFALVILGQLLGLRDVEDERCRSLAAAFNGSGDGQFIDEEARPRNKMVQKKDSSSAKEPSSVCLTELITVRQEMDQNSFFDLTNALKEAAAAHRACAAAEAEIARIYDALGKK
jgi:hypothetical protein